MLPLWIINLGADDAQAQKLGSLIDELPASVRPYWQYTCLNADVVADEKSYTALTEQLVEAGQACYNCFMKNGMRVSDFQIAVLGFTEDDLSQSIFAPMAGIIRDSLPRIIHDHANLGVELTGLLYIPSTANQEPDSSKRKRMAMFLEEVNLLSDSVNGYNRVVAYQDIQHVHCRYYGSLNSNDRTELLFQYLTHIFLGGRDNEKLFDHIGTEHGLYSLGAASVFFSPKEHRNHELNILLGSIEDEFKCKENCDEASAQLFASRIIDDKPFDERNLASRLTEGCCSIQVNLHEMEGEANPHPVRDFLKVELLPSYYGKYLRYMPARLLKFMQSFSYALMSRVTAIISNNSSETIKAGKLILKSLPGTVLCSKDNVFATIPQLQLCYIKSREDLIAKRQNLSVQFPDILNVPDYLKADYQQCVSRGEGGLNLNEIMGRLKQLLRKEPVILSLLVRCFLSGTLLVLLCVLTFGFMWPSALSNAWIWGPFLFLLPFALELGIRVRRHFKRVKRLKYTLLAATIYSVNQKLNKRLVKELDKAYESFISECDDCIDYLSTLSEALTIPEEQAIDRMLPVTRFNQPLFEGSFVDERMVSDDFDNQSEITLPPGKITSIAGLTKEDNLCLLKYFLMESSATEIICADNLPQDTAVRLTERFKFGLSALFQTVEESNITTALSRLGSNADLSPLKKMAGVNGMLFYDADSRNAIVKSSGTERIIENADIITEPALGNTLMLTFWKNLQNGLNVSNICDYKLDADPELSFCDKLALYYAFYRQTNSIYKIGHIPVVVNKTEMEKLDRMIRR